MELLSQRVSHTCTLLYIKAMEMKSFPLMSYPDEYRADDQQLSTDGTLVDIVFYLTDFMVSFYFILLFFRRFRFRMREGRGQERLVPC